MGRVTKRKSGQPLNIPAVEWNALADLASGVVTQSRGPLSSITQSISVLVRNDTGEDLDRYRCISLGDPLFDLAADGSADLIFEGKKADPNKPAAICVEPIAHDATNKRFGRVWLHGLAYAWVAPAAISATLLSAGPTPTSNRLLPGSGYAVRLLGAPSTSVEKLLPVLLGMDCGIVCKSPAGGIAPGSSASCVVWNRSGTNIVAGSSSINVYNLSASAIAGAVFMIALSTNIGHVSVWEDC